MYKPMKDKRFPNPGRSLNNNLEKAQRWFAGPKPRLLKHWLAACEKKSKEELGLLFAWHQELFRTWQKIERKKLFDSNLARRKEREQKWRESMAELDELKKSYREMTEQANAKHEESMQFCDLMRQKYAEKAQLLYQQGFNDGYSFRLFGFLDHQHRVDRRRDN